MRHWDIAIPNVNLKQFKIYRKNYELRETHYDYDKRSTFYKVFQLGLSFKIIQFPDISNIYLTTAFPQFINVSFTVFEPVISIIWLTIFLSLMALAITLMLVLQKYEQVMPQWCGVVNDPQKVWLRIIGGATESFDGRFFKFGITGSVLIMTFEILSYSIITVYNANLRSFIIGERPLRAYDTVKDMNWAKDQVIYTEGGLPAADPTSAVLVKRCVQNILKVLIFVLHRGLCNCHAWLPATSTKMHICKQKRD